MRQFQDCIRPEKSIPAGLQSDRERQRQAWERRWQFWEHLGAPARNLGAPATCLGAPQITVMYLVCILIYVSRYLYSYPSIHAISGLAAGGAWEQFEVRLKMKIQWTQIYTPRPWSRDFGDALGGSDQPYWEMHLEAVISHIWRCIWKPWSSVFGDVHLEGMIVHTWRPCSSESGEALGGHDCANLQATIEQVWR